jgi:hypothetical protein
MSISTLEEWYYELFYDDVAHTGSMGMSHIDIRVSVTTLGLYGSFCADVEPGVMSRGQAWKKLAVSRIEIGLGKLNYRIPWWPGYKFRNKAFLKISKNYEFGKFGDFSYMTSEVTWRARVMPEF